MLRIGSTQKTLLSLAAAVTMTSPVIVLADASNPEALSWARQKAKPQTNRPQANAEPRYRVKPVARAAAARLPAAPPQPVPEVLSFSPPSPSVFTPAAPPLAYTAQSSGLLAAPLAVTAVQTGTAPWIYGLIGTIIGAGLVLILHHHHDIKIIIVKHKDPVSP